MANEKITELTEVTAGNSAALDVIPIVDVSDTSVSITGQTKKITVSSLFNLPVSTDIVFEGSTDDEYETTLTVTDPTADRTVSLPNATDTLVGLATTDTLTNKTLTSPVINTGVSGTAVLDDDTFGTASSTTVATSESIKAYVDTRADLDFAGDGGTGTVDLSEQTFTIDTGANLTTAASSQTLTVNLDTTITGLTSVTSTAFVGGLTGAVTGNVTGDVTGNVTGDVTGDLTGDVTGDVTGNVSGTAATVTGATQTAITSAANLVTVGTIGTGVWQGTAVDGTYVDLEGTEIKSTGETGAAKFLREDGDGTCSWQTVAGDIESVTAGTNLNGGGSSGVVTLNLDATLTGLTSVTSTAFAGGLTGNVTGNVTGDVTGDLTGDSAGTHTGAVTGNVTGDLTGDVTGNVSGTAATVTGATQANITTCANLTTVGTLTDLTVSGTSTTIGTVTSGIWEGTPVAADQGGTDQSVYVVGDILYADGTDSLERLAAADDGNVLSLSSGIPAWGSAGSGTVTGTGTDAYVAVWSSASAIEGTSGFTYDSSGYTLNLARDGANYIFANAGSSSSLQIQGQSSLIFSTNVSQTERMRISNDGDVKIAGALGVGNILPASGYELDVNGKAIIRDDLDLWNDYCIQYFKKGNGTDTLGWILNRDEYGCQYVWADGQDLGFLTTTTGGTTTPRMTIASDGNVGIGIQTPPNVLSVSPVQYSTGTASQSGTTVTGSGTTWTTAMVGSQFVYTDGTSSGPITAFTSTTQVTVTTSQTVASQAYKIHYQGLQVASTGNVAVGSGSFSMTDDYAINWDGNNILKHDGTQTDIGDTSSSSAMILKEGKVGIGGTPSSEKLEVIGGNVGGAIATEIYNSDNGDGSVAQLMLSAGALNQTCIVRANSGGTSTGLGNYLDMVISNENASTSYGGIVFATSNSSGTLAERVTIDIEGNVGIGQDTPVFSSGSGLHIKNADQANLRLEDDSTEYFDVAMQAGDAYLINRVSDGIMSFRTNATERLKIESGGRVTVKKSSNSEIDDTLDLEDAGGGNYECTPDFDAANNFSLEMDQTGVTMQNPSNITAGQSGCIVITQAGTSKDIDSWGTAWHFEGGTAPTLSTGDDEVDNLVYYVATEIPSSIHAVLLKNFKTT